MAYSGSTVKSFTISSFYYACDISGQGAANAAPSCSFTLTGYKALSNTPVASHSFTFVPSEPVDAMQTMYELTLNSGFQQPLETVVFTASLLAATGLVSLVIDNLAGKLLCFYALWIMYHLALTVSRYPTVLEYDGFDVLDFTRSSQIVIKDRKSYIWRRSLHIAALYRFSASQFRNFITVVQTTVLLQLAKVNPSHFLCPSLWDYYAFKLRYGSAKGPILLIWSLQCSTRA